MLTPLLLGHFSPQKSGVGKLVKNGGGGLSTPYFFFMKIICSARILINVTKCDLEVYYFKWGTQLVIQTCRIRLKKERKIQIEINCTYYFLKIQLISTTQCGWLWFECSVLPFFLIVFRSPLGHISIILQVGGCVGRAYFFLIFLSSTSYLIFI